MKQLYILIMVLVLTLTGCASNSDSLEEENNEDETEDTLEEDIIEEDASLISLPYYAYLNKTNPVVTITIKDIGEIQLQLFPDVAKNTVDNFINYIQSDAYSSSTFHRVIKEFMIQGGVVKKTNCPIKGEFLSNGVKNDLSHYRGIISMARTSVKDSATSQFFIMHKLSTHLNGDYAAFGGLISGFDILDAIANVATGYADAPINKVVIESMSIKLNGYIVGNVNCS